MFRTISSLATVAAISIAAFIGIQTPRTDAQSPFTPPGFVQLACAQPAVAAAYPTYCGTVIPPTPAPTPVPTSTPNPLCPPFCTPAPTATPALAPMTVTVIARTAQGLSVGFGTTVTAFVGGVMCASGQTGLTGTVTLTLPAACGAVGASVTFTVGGQAASEGITFAPGTAVTLAIHPA